jgi:hypothetical protein
VVSVWDMQAKKRLRQFPKYSASISSLAFNSDGNKLAIAAAVSAEEGSGSAGRNGLYVRWVGEDVKVCFLVAYTVEPSHKFELMSCFGCLFFATAQEGVIGVLIAFYCCNGQGKQGTLRPMGSTNAYRPCSGARPGWPSHVKTTFQPI